MLASLVLVMLHPMLEEMFVPREEDSDVMFAEERHVFLPNDLARLLNLCPAVRPRREGWMMRVDDHVTVAASVKPIELRFDPPELLLVARYVRIECDEDRVAVAERENRIARQPPRRSFGRDQ